ncbi:alpha/beta fold hydrolase [Pseudarthrobacter sp. PS3-L1]|uniref:alpha/beta hydrolase family protein n=1 Tax=Pseudarthrobacter sp. PS3-L1 TaxID=3046207 RepID=UPI0024BA412A|nr:alpha/beta fold hydrolase [Pseudarthrobacter sp. PS3-L1]MDJ0320299.1 alpha/beta fold hydrolase [Pseudarthrobacter sp. PS3-L1]
MASSTKSPALRVESGMSLRTKWTIGGIIGGSSLAGVLAGGSSALAVYFARRVITPSRQRVADQEILAVPRDEHGGLSVILAATDDTTVDGVYSLYFDGGQGHARIGRIISYSPAERTVLRDVEEVYQGTLETATRGWWGGAIFPDPAAMGLDAEDVLIDVQNGQAPAWLIRPAEPGPVWAIMVHGRGASRQETLRAVPVAQAAGLTSLLISYRNDGEAPSADDGRYGLGSTEWEDVDAAIAYALAHGAAEVMLFGWSMGGAICLQAADLSRYRQLIRAMVLDAPVIDWINVLAHHAVLNRIPNLVGRYGQLMLAHPLGRRLTGLSAPVDLKAMDWVSRAVELRTPTLILHSVDDEYVPYGPSAALAERNPDMVRFETFQEARHTKEWNVDPGRWESLVRSWLQQQLAPRANPGDPAPAAPPL